MVYDEFLQVCWKRDADVPLERSSDGGCGKQLARVSFPVRILVVVFVFEQRAWRFPRLTVSNH